MQSDPSRPVHAAVVTGGHAYDVVNFHRLFRGLEGVDAYVQHFEDFRTSPQTVRDAYEAVVFYIHYKDPPGEGGVPLHAGRPVGALQRLGEVAQGIVLLHHAVLAYPDWDVWRRIVGIADPRMQGFQDDQTVRCEIAEADHPVTLGLQPWEMIDETYDAADPDPADSRILITNDHPKNMRALAWTRGHAAARVFCYQSGHDNQTWADANFREVLRRGILWSAGRL